MISLGFHYSEQMYNNVVDHESNMRLLLQQDSNMVIFILITILIIIIFFSWIVYYKRKKLSKTIGVIDLFQGMKANKNNRENDSAEVEFISIYSNDKEKTIKNALQTQLDIIKILANLDEKSDKYQYFIAKFDRLFCDDHCTIQINWDNLYSLIDLLYDDFAKKLQIIHATILSEKEIQLCCLLKANMNTIEIASLMRQSVNTVRTRKSNIRKKLNTPDAADIIMFLDESLQNQV